MIEKFPKFLIFVKIANGYQKKRSHPADPFNPAGQNFYDSNSRSCIISREIPPMCPKTMFLVIIDGVLLMIKKRNLRKMKL